MLLPLVPLLLPPAILLLLLLQLLLLLLCCLLLWLARCSVVPHSRLYLSLT